MVRTLRIQCDHSSAFDNVVKSRGKRKPGHRGLSLFGPAKIPRARWAQKRLGARSYSGAPVADMGQREHDPCQNQADDTKLTHVIRSLWSCNGR